MIAEGPSILSLIAATGYCVVALAGLLAAYQAKRSEEHNAHRWAWVAIAGFFALLVTARILSLEELVRTDLRVWLRSSGAYENRRDFQMPLTIALGLAASGFFVWLIIHWRNTIGRRAKAVIVAAIGVAGMVSLIALRSVSFSAFDRLLYGPLKLNWLVDVGSATLVLGAAIYYIHVARSSISSRGPSQ